MEYQKYAESFWGMVLATLKKTGKKMVPFFLGYCCTWMRGLELWQPSYAHEDSPWRQGHLTEMAAGRWEEPGSCVDAESLHEPWILYCLCTWCCMKW